MLYIQVCATGDIVCFFRVKRNLKPYNVNNTVITPKVFTQHINCELLFIAVAHTINAIEPRNP